MEPFDRKELKRRAKETLKKHFWMACLVCLIGILLGGRWNGLKQSAAPVNVTRILPSSSSSSSQDVNEALDELLGSDSDDPADTESSSDDFNDDYDAEMERFINKMTEAIQNTEKGQDFSYLYDDRLSSSDNIRDFMQAVLDYYGITEDDIVGIVLTLFGVILIILVFVWIISTIFRFLVGSFLGAPMGVGIRNYFLLSRTGTGKIDDVFSAFSGGHYMNVVKTMFSTNIRIFGWSLLFYFPGLVKYYEYYFVPYLMAENPELTPTEARNLSREMTDGIKWNIFVLEFSFLGWACLFALEEVLLTIFSLGLLAIPGLLLIYPLHAYRNATYAELYVSRKRRNVQPDTTLNEDMTYIL